MDKKMLLEKHKKAGKEMQVKTVQRRLGFSELF
jgi:hypothetical protein